MSDMKILKADEEVARGITSSKNPDMFLFENVTPDCIQGLIREAERVRAEIEATYFAEQFPSGLPNKLDVTLNGSRGGVEMNDFPLIPEAADYSHELTAAVRLAIRWILSEMRQRRSDRSWTVCAKFMKDATPRRPGSSRDKPCVYKVGM